MIARIPSLYHRGRKADGDHVNVVTGETVAPPRKLVDIRRAGKHRGYKAIKTDNIEKERIVGETCEEGGLTHRICCDHEWVRVSRQRLHRGRRGEPGPVGQLNRSRLGLAARDL